MPFVDCLYLALSSPALHFSPRPMANFRAAKKPNCFEGAEKPAETFAALATMNPSLTSKLQLIPGQLVGCSNQVYFRCISGFNEVATG